MRTLTDAFGNASDQAGDAEDDDDLSRSESGISAQGRTPGHDEDASRLQEDGRTNAQRQPKAAATAGPTRERSAKRRTMAGKETSSRLSPLSKSGSHFSSGKFGQRFSPALTMHPDQQNPFFDSLQYEDQAALSPLMRTLKSRDSVAAKRHYVR